MKAHPKKKRHQCEKPIYALDVPCRCTSMETSPFDRANGSSSARCGKQAARTPHKSEKCNVGRSSIGTGCRLSLLGCGYPFCWKPRRTRGSWVPTFVDSSQSYIGSGALGAHGAPCKAGRSKQWQAALKRRAAQFGPFCRVSILQWTTCGSMWRR